MLRRIRKDIKIEQVFATAEKMVEHGIAGHFPFIVGFPEESESSIQASLDVAKRLRAMSPDFLTPIFYFKPYPGSELVIEAVARGFRLPQTLEEWARFDYVAGMPGPWVTPEKFELIERFKFFQELAWKRAAPGKRLLQRLARYRCTKIFIAGRLRCCSRAGWFRRRSCHEHSTACSSDQPDDHQTSKRAISVRGAQSRRGARRKVRIQHY